VLLRDSLWAFEGSSEGLESARIASDIVFEALPCLCFWTSYFEGNLLIKTRGGGSNTTDSVQTLGQSLAKRTVGGRRMFVPPFSKEEGFLHGPSGFAMTQPVSAATPV
jgi:hypothetical protein